jgi:hypothetical protein
VLKAIRGSSMSGARLILPAGAVLILVAGAPPSAASAKGVLRLSDGGVPVAQEATVGFRLVLMPEGFSGSALQVGDGPLVNESRVDGIKATAGADGSGSWLIDGSIEAIGLGSNGKATITTSGEAIANNEPEPPPPPARPSLNKWECFYPLPKTLRGAFSTGGAAVVTGGARAKPSKACHLPGFGVTFTLELLPESLSGPPLEAGLLR